MFSNIGKQLFLQGKDLGICEALGNLLRIPLTETKKLRILVLVSTLKPIIYKPRCLFFSCQAKGILDRLSMD